LFLKIRSNAVFLCGLPFNGETHKNCLKFLVAGKNETCHKVGIFMLGNWYLYNKCLKIIEFIHQ